MKQHKITKKVFLSRKKSFRKSVIYFVLSLCLGVLFVVSKNYIISNDKIYTHIVKNADIDSSNIVFYKYDVFATEERYNLKKDEKIQEMVLNFKERNSVLLVKTRGEENVIRHDDYILKQDMTVPDLNIEFYVVKNMDFLNYNLPIDSFIPLAFHYMDLINFYTYIVKNILFIILSYLFSYKYIYYISQYHIIKNIRFSFE